MLQIITAVGSIAAFVASLLMLANALVARRQARGASNTSRPPLAVLRNVALLAFVRIRRRLRLSDPIIPYLLRQEIMIIVPAGLLLNYLGFAISAPLKSVVYLDMVGTGLVSFLLGPWWGATTGLLSNSVVNALLSGRPAPIVNVFPWSLVNIMGGIVWGLMARRIVFRVYLASPRVCWRDELGYLAMFGVVGAGAMSVVGTMISAALANDARLVPLIDPDIVDAMNKLFEHWPDTLGWILKPIIGPWAPVLANGIPKFVQTWLLYIPDKTLSAAFALAALRYGFPLFGRELLIRPDSKESTFDNWTGPTVLGIMYFPSFIFLMIDNDETRNDNFLWLWWLPLIAVFYGLWLVRKESLTLANPIKAERQRRLEAYGEFGTLEVDTSFFAMLKYIMLLATTIFIVGILILGNPRFVFFQVTFNLFALVYGSLLAIYLTRVSVFQNFAVITSEAKAAVRVPTAIPAPVTAIPGDAAVIVTRFNNDVQSIRGLENGR